MGQVRVDCVGDSFAVHRNLLGAEEVVEVLVLAVEGLDVQTVRSERLGLHPREVYLGRMREKKGNVDTPRDQSFSSSLSSFLMELLRIGKGPKTLSANVLLPNGEKLVNGGRQAKCPERPWD